MPASAAGLRARVGAAVLSGRGVFLIWAVLLVLLWAMRAFLFGATGADDAEQLVNSQDWAWGYGPRNPPLFTWLVILSQSVFGVSIASVVTVKFALLGGAMILLHRIARRVTGDERLAALAALAPLGLYYVAWVTAFNYTHSALLAFAVCLCVQAFLVLAESASVRSYLLFGVTLGVGLLSKYNFLVFLGAFLLAALTGRTTRGVVLDRRMLLSAAVAAIITGPHAAWLWRHRDLLDAILRDRFIPNGGTAHLDAALSGIWETALGAASFLLPLLVFLALLFPRGFARLPNGATRDPHGRLLARAFLFAMGITLAGVAAFGIERVRPHYMYPLILFPVFFFARIRAAGVDARAANRFAVLAVALSLVVPASVLVKYAMDPLRDGKAYLHMPYDAFARQFRAAGFRQGTILGDWLRYPVAGNLRLHFPDSRIVAVPVWERGARRKTDDDGRQRRNPVVKGGQCLVVWSPRSTDWRDRFMRDAARRMLGASFPPDRAPGRVSAPMPHGGGRVATLRYLLAPNGSGDCR